MKKFFVFAIAIMMLVVASLPAAAQEEQSILDIAEEDGRFEAFVAAIQTSGLLEILEREGPFTVFAPTDDAFSNLPAGTLETLLLDPNTLSQILTYHVVADPIMAVDLIIQNGQEIPTLQGETIMINGDGENQIIINDANVIMSDIEASNGVIHLIDKILIPPTLADEIGISEEPPAEPTAELAPTPEPTAELAPTPEPTAELAPTPEPTPEPVPPPSTIPNTGADKRQSLPLMPALMIISGLLLLAVAYTLRQPRLLE